MNGPKYPILMIHGMGFRDYKRINYWGRIPAELQKMGCKIFYGYQDSNGSISSNGNTIKLRIEEILNETKAEKVNIIAHSKGGLDSRYAISSLGMADKVASLTTMSTPHNGSKTVDKLLQFPSSIVRFVGFCTDCWFRLLGDKSPSSYEVFRSFTTSEAAEFNRNNPNIESVYYQSYAFVMKKPTSDIFLLFPSMFVKAIEGENDGLLTPDSVKWGDFKGICRSNGNRGISHCDEVDMRRRILSKKKGEGVSDIIDIYKSAVCNLIELGF